jgi:type IV pilus modification protein PilV
MMLIEVLVSILILIVGVLGLAAAFARTTTTQTDVDTRAMAARYTSEILSQISIRVDRTSDATIAASLAPMVHQPDPAPSVAGVPGDCPFAGAASIDPDVADWVARITDPLSPQRLPGATPAMQQIFVGALNEVTVVVCWQSSGDRAPRRHVQRAYIN